jgi:predicted metalloendopeptidase
MPALIRTPDGSIGFVSDAGTLDAISSLNEVESLKASGVVGNWVQLQDMNIWNTLAARTARLRAQHGEVDPKKLAAEIAALMVGPVVEAVADAGGLTQAEVEAAVESVTKRLLAKAAA